MFTIDDLNEKMIKNLKFNAVRSLKPDAQFNIDPNGTVRFHDDTQLTNIEIEAEMDRLRTLWYNYQYSRNRANEYPSIGDQLDALYHAGVFPEEMAAQIAAIKAKYPKANT